MSNQLSSLSHRSTSCWSEVIDGAMTSLIYPKRTAHILAGIWVGHWEKWLSEYTESSAIAQRSRDAKACQRLLKFCGRILYSFWDIWCENDHLDWNDLQMSFNVIKSGTNRKPVYDFLLILCSNRYEKFDVKQSNDLEISQGHRQSYHLKAVVWFIISNFSFCGRIVYNFRNIGRVNNNMLKWPSNAIHFTIVFSDVCEKNQKSFIRLLAPLKTFV